MIKPTIVVSDWSSPLVAFLKIMNTKRMAMTMLVACVFSFATHEALAFYNPSTGRWLSRDPIAEPGGSNLYGFVGNNPISFCDVLGKDSITYNYHDSENNQSTLEINANVSSALICSGGFLLFSIHFQSTEDDQGNKYLSRYGLAPTFDGNASPLDN